MRQIISGLLAVWCIAGAVAACSPSSIHEPHPTAATATTTPSPTSSDTATPPATATPTPADTATTPQLTGAAVTPGQIPPTHNHDENQDNAAGALAFAAYFYKALDWSIATTNPNLLRNISAPECSTCEYYIHGLDSLAAAGGHSTGGRGHIAQLMITTGTEVKADYVVKVTLEQQPEVIVSPGAAPVTYPAGSGPAVNYLYVSWRDDRWQAIQITRPR